jgi:hypothetical protein
MFITSRSWIVNLYYMLAGKLNKKAGHQKINSDVLHPSKNYSCLM